MVFRIFNRFKRPVLLLLSMILALSLCGSPLKANADYIGPRNRTTTTTTTQHLRVCYNSSGKIECTCVSDGGECDVTSNPCPNNRCVSCDEQTKEVTTTTNLPNATVAGTFSCGSPGSNGWCRGGANLALSANEPVSGYVIQNIEGSPGVMCNPADAATVNCNWAPPEGQTNLEYWAHSSFGDTSLKGTQSILLDSGNPSVTLSVPAPNGQNGWFISPVSISASASDGVSGVANIQAHIDAGSWQNGPVSVTAQGVHTAQAQAADKAGNTATSSVASFKLDTVPPNVIPSIPAVDGQNGWFVSAPTVSVTGSDATSGLASAEVQVDSGSWQTGNAMIAVDGSHTLNFRVQDNAGNLASSSATVHVDRTAPVLNVNLDGTPGQNGWYRSLVNVSPDAKDTISGVSTLEAQVGNGTWLTTFPLTVREGRNDLAVRAVDKAGNLTTATQSVLVDVTPPMLSASIPHPDGQNGWFVSSPTLKVSGTDQTSGMASSLLRVDAGNWAANEETIEQSGMHTVEFQTQDMAGNMTTQTASVKVDLQGPAIQLNTIGTSGRNNWYTSPEVNVSADVTDLFSGVSQTEVRLDGGSWRTGSQITIQGEGTHQVEFRSTDNAGNTSLRSQIVQIDSIAPVINLGVDALAGLNGWYRSKATVTAEAVDKVSGVAQTEISVDGGDWELTNEVELDDDGVHQLEFRAMDKAGNLATLSKTIKIDQHDPIGYFIEPQGGTRVKGQIVIGGTVHDDLSGMGKVDLSLDEGNTWQVVNIKPDGSWLAAWNTLEVSSGMHNLQVRFTDLAGNTSSGKLFITVANRPPALQLTERWYIWEKGLLDVIPGDIDILTVSIDVIDPQGRWPAEHLEYRRDQPQQDVVWDRHFGNILAPIGEYLVKVKAVDVLAQEVQVQGMIVIPPVDTPTVTPTPVMTRTVTATLIVRPTVTATVKPSMIPTQTRTAVPVATLVATKPASKPAKSTFGLLFWLVAFVVLGLFVVLATTSLIDRRYQELRKLIRLIKDQER